MQKKFAGQTAKQILKSATADQDGRKFVVIYGTQYTVVEHDRVELANGSYTSTVVIENPDNRIVLDAK